MTVAGAIPQFMGVRVKRREDPDLITGKGKYVADIALDNLAHAAILRSPYAHARILSINTSAAEAMPGVIAVLTGDDINPHMAAPLPMVAEEGGPFKVVRNPGRLPMATGKVCHVGDPVAVVVAEDRYTAADAVEVIEVDYDPLDAVTDPEASLTAEASVIHEQWGDNLAYHFVHADDSVDEVFAQAEVVAEVRVVNQRLIPSAMEPRAVTAGYDAESDSFTVWTSTQCPHIVKDEASEVLGHSAEKFRVIAPEVGGGFGAKSNVHSEEVLIPFLARHVERPVAWAATRSEDNLSTIHGRDQIDILRLAATTAG